MYSTEIRKFKMRRLYIILACLMFCIISYADVSPSCQNGAILDIKDGKLWHKSFFSVEFPEYNRSVLETLRQPLEDRQIQISRAKYSVTLPCSFQLVAAMNPCPCGYYNDPQRDCTCSPGQIQRYMNKISGPLMDRIDLQVEVMPVPLKALADAPAGEPSASIRERVVKARAIQSERFKDEPGIHCNAQMNTRLLNRYARPDDEAMDYLMKAMTRLNLSARAYERVLKVARTIADLAAAPTIQRLHIAEALSYRNLDRSTWGE